MCPLLLPNHSLWQWWDRFLHRQLQFSCRHHSYNTQFHPSHTYVREAAPTVEKDNLCREIASSRIAPVKNFCNFMCQFTNNYYQEIAVVSKTIWIILVLCFIYVIFMMAEQTNGLSLTHALNYHYIARQFNICVQEPKKTFVFSGCKKIETAKIYKSIKSVTIF